MTEPKITKGMTVKTLDGVILGKIASRQVDRFTIEKGLFFPENYVASTQDILCVARGLVILTQIKRDFLSHDYEEGVEDHAA